MEAGTSQMAIEGPPVKSRVKERKPRHKVLKQIQKGKEREDEVSNILPSKSTKSSSLKPQLRDGYGNVGLDSSWSWQSLTDSSVNPFPPLFTKDYRYFFLISGTTIKIYSTATGNVVSTLSSSSGAGPSSSQDAGHSAEITSILINPQNAFQLISASLDGYIKIWDYLEAVLLSTFNIKVPVTHMCAHDRQPGYVFITTTSTDALEKENDPDNQRSSRVFRISLKATKATSHLPIQLPLETLRIGRVKSPKGLAISPSGEWLVAIGGPKAYVCPLSSLDTGFTKFISDEPLTSLAFHPTQEYFATGDHKGRIRLWYCLDSSLIALGKGSAKDEDKRAQTTTLHWHAHAVSSLAFSSNGAYLLSGGEEAVLVIWQLHTGKKEFVPRVGSPIVSVAVMSHQNVEEEYLLVLSDGTLVMIGANSLRISKSFARIKHDSTLWGSGPAPLAVHPLTSTIILPSSHPSSLLVYSPSTSTATAELEISPTNRVSRREDTPIIPCRVERVVTSHNGQWMATIDGRPRSVDFAREVYLKIWRWDASSSTWNLNSRIDRPHGPHRVVAMEFIPSLAGATPYLVTCGEDCNVKMWRIKTILSKAGHEEFWVCRSTFGYRSRMPSNVVYSPDGSLIAVSYGLYAVIYDVASNGIRTTLTCPDLRDISHMCFIGETGQYFVITDNCMIYVWDLVALTVRWQYPTQDTIEHVVPHPKQDAFVVLSTNQDHSTSVYKFMATSPSSKKSRTLPFKLKNALWYPFGVSGKDFSLIGITHNWASVVFGDKLRVIQDEGASAREISGDAAPGRRSVFQDMFGVTAFDNLPSQAPQPVLRPATDISSDDVLKLSGLFDVPSYQLAPMSTLFPSILENLLHERIPEPTVEQGGNDIQQPEEDDIPMADAVISKTTRPSEQGLSSEGMQELIELFKSDLFASKTAPSSQNRLNGNGMSKATNGVNHTQKLYSTSPKLANGKHSAIDPQQKDETEGSISVGKKRKKT